MLLLGMKASGLQITKLSLFPFLTDSWSPTIEAITRKVKRRTQDLYFQVRSQVRLRLEARGRFAAPKQLLLYNPETC